MSSRTSRTCHKPCSDLENVVLVPHIGSASVATRTRMAVMAAENLVAVLRGVSTPHVVNPAAMTQGATSF